MTTTRDARQVVVVERFVVRSAVSLVAASAAGVAFAVVMAVVWTGWAPVREVDQAISEGLTRWVGGSGGLGAVLGGITRLGDTATLTGVTALAVAWLLLRRRPRVAAHVVVTTVGGGLLGVVVKELVGRLRPLVEVEVATAPGWSFPSGHTLGATVTYGVLLLVFASARRARRRLTSLVVVVVVLVGCTRVALGVHYATDVLGGWLLGLVWLALTTEVFRQWRRDEGLPEAPLSGGLAPEAADDLRPLAGRPVHVPSDLRLVAARLLVVWVLLLGALFALGSWLTAAGPDVPTAWDRGVVEWIAERRVPGWDAAMGKVEAFSGTWPVMGAAVVVCVLALARTRSWRPVLLVVLGMLGEVTLFLLTTAIIERARPAAKLPEHLPPTSSFPSGHVAASLVLGASVAVLVVRGTTRWWRWVVAAAALAVPVVVAAQRLYTGVHYPTDLLGSLLLALPWVTAVALATISAAPPAAGSGPRPWSRPR
ncbi:phosphatase PAP2 family protein [Saccharothrix sp. 6-C]|uniref:phosphatase PAP2 family protein n=1 Tax=Saccharothrix sp. 6-C TaxID=2781735 RepID=UPI001916DB03|nr:phosphatase PAP2 family protein [Saccharothrix sp. 6-C]QQQ78277.1 phosphatase PAP2 family protein [Saccharothrix sp. 6-C]